MPPRAPVSSWLWPVALNEADEIADDFDLIDVVIRDLQAGEFIFDHDYQFKTIEPVGPEVIDEICLVRHTFDFDAQMLGNESANVTAAKIFFHSRGPLHRRKFDGHDEFPNSLTYSASD
jgi:hypothetical protein